MGWPRRAHCGAFSGARTDAGIGVAHARMLQCASVIRAQCGYAVHCCSVIFRSFYLYIQSVLLHLVCFEPSQRGK